MRRHAKASSAGPTMRQARGLGRIFRGALATRGASRNDQGRGAPSSKLLLGFAAALLATMALGVTLATAVSPVVTIEDAFDVRNTTAKAKGTVNPEEKWTSYHFEYVTQGQFEGSEWAEASWAGYNEIETGNTAQAVEATLEGLNPGSTYHLRLVASNEDDQSEAVATNTFETEEVAKPSATISAPTEITGTSAVFHGEVNPNAPGDSEAEAQDPGYNTEWYFTCVPGCSPIGGPPVEGDDDFHPVEIGGFYGPLEPNTNYAVTLHATNAGGENEVPAETTFKTAALPATVGNPQPTSVNDLRGTSAWLTAFVNVQNSEFTECFFEWGETSSYGNTEPCQGDTPAGNKSFAMGAPISGLSPETTYHFRVVAANLAGTGEGEDQEFTTLAEAPAAATCPNQSIREEQRATFLAECRAWERVSPADKNGGDIEGYNTLFASPDNDAMVYTSRAGFAETQGSGNFGFTQYLARRHETGWFSRSINPRPALNGLQIAVGASAMALFSNDFSRTIVPGYDLPGTSDDIANALNLYSEETDTGVLHAITGGITAPVSATFDHANITGGASADLRQVSFPSRAHLLPEAAAGVRNAYEWDNGTLRLAGILPGGSVPAEGSEIPYNLDGEGYRATVSADGSRLLFTSPAGGEGQLYLRRNHASTALVSESEGSTPVTSPSEVRLGWASPDGRHILFTTTSALLDGDTNEGRDLYLYTDSPDPTSESNLTLISDAGDVGGGPNRSAVIGAADDASRIYFQNDNSGGVYFWDQGDLERLPIDLGSAGSDGPSVNSKPGSARVSSDGTRLAFLAAMPGGGVVYGRTGAPTGDSNQMYLYDSSSGTLVCASCPPEGSAGTSGAEIVAEPQPDKSPQIHHRYLRPNFLSSDGNYVFFSTAEALVPEDQNHLADAYVYEAKTGEVSLLSSGRDETGTWFGNASTSGHDVFLLTAQQLVGADGDPLVDVYDARVDGGFPEPPPPPTPCSGDGCRGSFSGAPNGPSAATQSFSGPGNPHRKHKRRKHRRRGAKHHVKRPTTQANRGGSK